MEGDPSFHLVGFPSPEAGTGAGVNTLEGEREAN